MSKIDLALLEKLRTRDSHALSEVVQENTKHLYNASLKLGFTPPEAEDLTQNVWITFFDIVNRFEGNSSIKTFLFGILYNKASELRKQKKRVEPTEEIEKIVDAHFDNHGHWIKSPVDPEKFLHSTQMMDLIKKCLEFLPLNQKMAFLLRDLNEESTEETCNILSVTATNLGVLLYRARNQLRECIERKSS
ncbi:MAG: RNA polymerase sigma factor [Pseudobdellovibrionaceae bacterium]